LGVSPDGSTVFVTGTSASDYATVAYDASTGAKLWVERYVSPAIKDAAATAFGVSPEGSMVFVTGRSVGVGTHYDYVTVAYDAISGAQLGLKRYDGPASLRDAATALGVSPDSSTVFVTGGSKRSGIGPDYAAVAYDAATGAQLWVKRYDGPASAGDNALA